MSLYRPWKNYMAHTDLKGPGFCRDGATDKRHALKGHGFSRANKPNQINGALAPEGCISRISPKFDPFPAACSRPCRSIPKQLEN
jgi:hypothetical protein